MVQFNVTDTYNHHKCYSEKEGDWLVYRCFLCDDFERRYHTRTRTWKHKQHPDNPALHHGMWQSPALAIADKNDNTNYTN